MCGIAGFFNFDFSRAKSEKIIREMTFALKSRGPNERGFFVDKKSALGHSRLAIIDLKSGQQPIFNENKNLVLVYNGEIYNFLALKKELEIFDHKFLTNSDSEVILHAFEEWGEKCLNRFNGMFAFAIYNRQKQELFLARDQFGKKPLYYAVLSNKIIFASELKAILKHPAIKKELNLSALSKYLAFEYLPAPNTIFKNIFKLPAGQWFRCQKSEVRCQKYWDLKFSSKEMSFKDAKEKFHQLFYNAVERRLISEVPLGVFLSGGIDSSSIVAMMTNLMPAKKIKTFSIGFSEKSFDETIYAKQVTDYFGTNHHHQNFSASTMQKILPEVFNYLDEPFADASILPTYLLSKFTKKYVTVALGGDGGDEMLAGYPTFIAHKMKKNYSRLPEFLRHYFIEPIVFNLPTSTENFSFDFKAKQFLKGVNLSDESQFQTWLGAFAPEEQKELFAENINLDFSQKAIYQPIENQLKKQKFPDSVAKLIYLYSKFYLSDDILFKVDRASMANSLEVRAPFLDLDLVEFLATVPSSYKIHGLKTKYLLKEAMKNELPKNIINRPKKGFGIPLSEWFKTDLKKMLETELASQKIKRAGLFKPEAVEKLLTDHWGGKIDNRKKIWTLLVFEMWRKKWL